MSAVGSVSAHAPGTTGRRGFDLEASREAADPAIDALPIALRGELAAIWAMRAGMELHVAGGFATIARELLETGADPAVLSICARAVDEEIEHAWICLALARRHDRREHPWPAASPLFVPHHDGETGRALATLHLVAMSCLNESIATVRLGAAIDDTRSPVVAAGLRAILADEIVHARAGWAHLASPFVADATRHAVATWLPAMLEASLRGLVDENAAIPPAGHAELGLPSIEQTRDVVIAAVEELVLPGFERVGIAVAEARHVAHAWGVGAAS